MKILDIVQKTRTARRFKQHLPITTDTLHQLIELGRLGGSARNSQPWQYMLVNEAPLTERIFPHLGWAGYLPQWRGPVPGEQPSCYILCLLNRDRLIGTEQEAHFDLGIATQNMLLGATELGYGGCRIGAFSPQINDLFIIPDHLELSLVIALGVPHEEVRIEEVGPDGKIKYWRDDNEVHHVPKRALEDCLVTLPCT